MASPNSPGDDVSRERDRLIRKIINKRTKSGGGVGIYGAEVCQICGEIDTFRGWASAVGFHFSLDFVCWWCRDEIIGDISDMSERSRLIGKALDPQPYRYCEVCRNKVAPSEKQSRKYLCAECRSCISRLDDVVNLDEFLHELPRRRYLNQELADDDKLRDFAELMEEFRQDLDGDGL